MYNVPIKKEESSNETVQSIVNNDFGFLITATPRTKPIALPPKCFFQGNVHRLIDREHYFNPNILDYIRKIVIHLGGPCSYDCSFCNSYYRQIRHCTKGTSILSECQLRKIASIIKQINPVTVELIWSKSSLSRIRNIVSLFQSLKGFKIYHVNIIYLEIGELIAINDIDSLALIKIAIDIELFENYSSLERQMKKFIDYGNKCVFVFICTSERDLRIAYKCIEKNVYNFEIKCLYGGKTYSFLDKHFFLNLSDLQNLSLDMNSIFAHQNLNYDLFGTIVIDSNANLRFDENSHTIGSIDDSWYVMINNEFYRNDNPWLWIRDNPPCSNCAYQFLCPPISSLEIFTGRHCICSDYYKSL